MVGLGYTLSSEELGPLELVDCARAAEDAGFEFAFISDHYHPWTTRQGHSPFVWSVIGGIAASTSRIRIGTGVTCPTVRIHPAIVAQAAATAAAMLPGRFMLGVGSGELLNEHILGDAWPPPATRLEMLEEAVDVIRELWTGEQVTHYGSHYTVEAARIFTLPDAAPPILVAGSGSTSTALAAANDGFITTAPDPEAVGTFREQGGQGKPVYGQLAVSWAETDEAARTQAHEWWPTSAMPGPIHWELGLPEHFDALAANLTVDDVAASMPCGSTAGPFIDAIQAYADAGFDHVYLHQVGRNQQAFIDFFVREIAPAFR